VTAELNVGDIYMLMLTYRFIYALSLVTELRRLRHESHLQLSPELFMLQGWWF